MRMQLSCRSSHFWEQIVLDCGRSSTQLMRDSLGGSSLLLLISRHREHSTMRICSRSSVTLLAILALTRTQLSAAQALVPPLPSWRPQRIGPPAAYVLASDVRVPSSPAVQSSGHRHTVTGLLIGGIIGTVATGVFLAAFCSDPDTHCGADEVGRAFVIIAVPPALLGATIGSLVRTKT